MLERVAEILELLLHQEPRDRRLEQVGDGFGRRVSAMRRAERIVDVKIAEGGERRGQLRVVLLFTRDEAGVLDECHAAARQASRSSHALRRIGDELHGGAEHALQIADDLL